ncbi:MAG TPA: hypothetical protein PKY82_12590 [Pyrinomonadaceae bacterium]|nr:hypothetical protein [Pyrinomonadaceae bacterium]
MNNNIPKKQNSKPEGKFSDAEIIEALETCLGEGWAPTRCPEGCRVEPDGLCSHGFESVLLENDLI